MCRPMLQKESCCVRSSRWKNAHMDLWMGVSAEIYNLFYTQLRIVMCRPT